jgi:hypothetical protein
MQVLDKEFGRYITREAGILLRGYSKSIRNLRLNQGFSSSINMKHARPLTSLKYYYIYLFLIAANKRVLSLKYLARQ